MTYQQLSGKIAIISDRDFILYPAGIKGKFHLGETDCAGLQLIDATAEEVLKYIQSNP